jgi:hypothetical protein
MGMAASLCKYSGNNEDYRLRLREIGIPTIFELNIPIHKISKNQIFDLMENIILSWASINLHQEEINYHSGRGFVVHSDIEPSCIVNHYHPKCIIDPHFHDIPYYPKITKCEICK